MTLPLAPGQRFAACNDGKITFKKVIAHVTQESEGSIEAPLIQIIEKQAVDIIMPDISKCGGLSECRKIANMAETYYIPFAPHNNSSALSTVGDAHVCASVPNFLALEFHRFDDPTWNDVVNSDEAVIQEV